jgi:hypothetical protein
MRKLYFGLAFALGLNCYNAYAQTKPESTFLTVREAGKVLDAIQVIRQGAPKVLKDGATEKSIFVPYDLSSELWKLFTKDEQLIQPVMDRYGKARQEVLLRIMCPPAAELTNDLLKACKGAKSPTPDSIEFLLFDREVQKLLDDKDEYVGLGRIKISELKLDANPGLGGLLVALRPIIQE